MAPEPIENLKESSAAPPLWRKLGNLCPCARDGTKDHQAYCVDGKGRELPGTVAKRPDGGHPEEQDWSHWSAPPARVQSCDPSDTSHRVVARLITYRGEASEVAKLLATAKPVGVHRWRGCTAEVVIDAIEPGLDKAVESIADRYLAHEAYISGGAAEYDTQEHRDVGLLLGVISSKRDMRRAADESALKMCEARNAREAELIDESKRHEAAAEQLAHQLELRTQELEAARAEVRRQADDLFRYRLGTATP